ncbi:hypothetical protein SDC9_134192 [bioreactor metagenome]|uniref:Uncharacterized protein n=1 Tax=bioreactor metagenome TaxID=1076179 RepID=A0A645DCY8_9ZZZZ|nr:hypothetical protein [Lachnospiraceae bacterium]
MEKDITKILSDPAFDCIETAEKADFIKLYTDIQGKSAREAIGIFLSRKDSLTGGKPLNEAKRKAIAEVLKSALSPSERSELEKMMIVFESMRRT